MFKRLRKKWKVNGLQLMLILCTFAIGGSATGFAAKKIINALPIGQDWLWAVIYIILVTLLWPLAVLLISIPFGQFRFFSRYIRKLGAKMGLGMQSNIIDNEPVHLTIFASGKGSNAQRIIDHFRGHPTVKIALIVSNNPGAGVLDMAKRENIPTLVLEKEKFFRGDGYVHELIKKKTDWVVLAGFLWKVPATLVSAYRDHIINIHPALLPKFGGKGMYGHHVHEAVLAAGETESGITIHQVDDQYDHGQVIFQARCPVLPGDTPEKLAERVLQLEHRHFPEVIEKLVEERLSTLKG